MIGMAPSIGVSSASFIASESGVPERVLILMQLAFGANDHCYHTTCGPFVQPGMAADAQFALAMGYAFSPSLGHSGSIGEVAA